MSKEIKSVTEKSTKAELMDALKNAMAKIEELEGGKVNFEAEVKEKKKAEVVQKTESVFVPELIAMIEDLRGKVDKINTALHSYNEIKEAIIYKNEELKELLGIEAETFNLAALINAQRDLKTKVDLEIAEKKAEADRVYKSTMDEAKTILDDAKLRMVHQEKEDRERRKREEDEWKYKFERDKVIAKDNLNDELKTEKREKLLELDEREYFLRDREKVLDDRELAIRQNEELLESLKFKVEELQAKVIEVAKTSEDEGRHKAAKAFGYEKSLLLKDCESQVNVLQSKNETLLDQLDDANKRIVGLTQKLDESYSRIQEMASKSVEGASNSKIIATLEGALKEKSGANKA